MGGDGIWDELCFLQDFNSKQRLELKVEVFDEKPVNLAPVRAHVGHWRRNENGFGDDLVSDSIPPGQLPTDFTKMKLPGFLTEGPAWGINDKEMN